MILSTNIRPGAMDSISLLVQIIYPSKGMEKSIIPALSDAAIRDVSSDGQEGVFSG